MRSNQNRTLFKGVLSGATISVASMLIAVFVMSMLVHSGQVSEAAIQYGTLIILMLSSILGSAVATNLINEKRIAIGSLTALIYALALLGITALFFDGMYQGVLVTVFVVFGMSMIPGVITINRKKSGKIKRKFSVNR